MRSVDGCRGEAAAQAAWTWSPADRVNVLLDVDATRVRRSEGESIGDRAAVGGHSPREAGVPLALQAMIDRGIAMREDEMAWMVGLLDPAMPQAAHGARAWTPGDWLDHLLDRRRARR